MWFAVAAGGFLVDMATTEGNKQGILKGNGGQQGTRTNWSHKREQGYDDSPMTTSNGAFKGSTREYGHNVPQQQIGRSEVALGNRATMATRQLWQPSNDGSLATKA
jgi:hypothetical protein